MGQCQIQKFWVNIPKMWCNTNSPAHKIIQIIQKSLVLSHVWKIKTQPKKGIATVSHLGLASHGVPAIESSWFREKYTIP